MKVTKNKPSEAAVLETQNSKFTEVLSHIKCAIDVLGPLAKSDQVAREALVNLGVIAVDLNSTKSPRR